MNANSSGEGWDTGKLLGVTRSLPPVTVDCSGWEADISDEQWSKGQLEGVARSLPPGEVDCSHWDASLPLWLELVVSFEAATPPTRVIEHTNRLIVAATLAAPELGLVYDVNHSRAEKDDVVIALAPRNRVGSAERLSALAEVIRQATESIPSPSPIAVRIGHAA